VVAVGVVGDGEVRVILVDGEAASGLGEMTCQYLQQILEEDPSKRRQALGLRGRLGLEAAEGGIAVTLSFEGEEIRIQNGLLEPVDAYIAGPFQLLIEVLGGQANPYREVLRRRLRVRPSLRRPLFGLRAYGFMRLAEPREGGGGAAGRPWLLAAAVVAGVVTGLLVVLLRDGHGEE
jgi:hypothetical protein